MKFVDYYRLLGVKKNASTEEIRKAYLKLAKLHHPDRGGDEKKMHRINEAYETLRDVRSRALYDEIHKSRYSPDSGLGFYTEAFGKEQDRQQNLRHHIKNLKRYLGIFVISLVAMLLLVALSTSSFYLIFVVPIAYAVIQSCVAIYHVSKIRVKSQKKFGSHNISRSFQIWSSTFALGAAMLILSFAGLRVAIEGRPKRSDPINQSAHTIYEDELNKINEARVAYETCIQEFTELTNQLNRINQQIDNAIQSNDALSYDRLKNEREQAVKAFDDKRNDCNNLQSAYNDTLKSYRERTNNQ